MPGTGIFTISKVHNTVQHLHEQNIEGSDVTLSLTYMYSLTAEYTN